jgi:xanthine dehydrogenase YagS FAD-binding subunit
VGRRRDDEVEVTALALGGVAPMPWRLEAAERLLAGRAADESLVRSAIARSLAEAEPLAGNGFKVELAIRVATRAVLDLPEGR